MAPDAQLRQIADRLTDVAAGVARDAASATQAVRGVAEHARDIAALAAELERTAETVSIEVAQHLSLIEQAHHAASENGAVLNALAHTAGSIGTLADRIAGIAGTSRLLALNARIEAARAGDKGNGFAVVAEEMASLATQTKAATHDIAERASTIGSNVETAHQVISLGSELVLLQQGRMDTIARSADVQRGSATAVAALTRETVARVDETAVGIGRVASAASVVRLLASQVMKMASTNVAA